MLTDLPPVARRAAIATALFAFGLLVNLHYGRRGFMPLDQGIVFDGAWRLMQGQVPYRDFTAPNALVPSILQVPFFATLGVTWFAFVLHASAINGLFSVLAYAFLRLCAASRAEAIVFAALSAFFFYPPNGTPFMDQHAFFFTALAFFAAYAGSITESPTDERVFWALVPWFLALGYLSKQIPTAFGAVTLIAWVATNPRRAPRWLAAAGLGLAALLVLLAVLWLTLGIHLRDAWTSVVSMPLDIGAERTPGDTAAAPFRLVLGTTRRLPGWAHLWSMWVVVAGLAALAVSRASSPRRRETLWLLVAMALTNGAFSAYTLNQLENGYCLVMLAAGIAAVGLRRTVASVVPSRRARVAAVATSALVIAGAVRDTVVFARDVDATRVVLDTRFDPAIAEQAKPYLPAPLRFLEWTNVNCTAEQFLQLLNYLASRPHNFVLISDLTPLYALTGKPSVGPALWLHPGLTFPHPHSEKLPQFEETLLARMRAYDARYVVIDLPLTGRFVKLADFPNLEALVKSKQCSEQSFGDVRVVELCE